MSQQSQVFKTNLSPNLKNKESPMDLLRTLVQVTLVAAMAAETSGQAMPDCQDSCGNISIPYPFGTRPGCYYDNAFLVTCNNAFIPPKPFLGTSNIEITNISVHGQLNILQFIARDCYNQKGTIPNIWLSKFKISSTRNKFTAIGCDTRASIVGKKSIENKPKRYISGCMTACDSLDYVTNGSCSGIGCCQTSIPTGVESYSVQLSSSFNHRFVWKFSPCSYAFVVEEDKFNFSSNYLTDLKSVEKLPVVLDWAIGDEICSVANKSARYACKADNSYCYEVDFAPGYRCNCSQGYHGNPYLDLPNACQDIDECEDPSLNQCEKICENTPGNYTCSCPKGYHGDGRKDGKGCIPDQLRVIMIIVGVGMGILVLIVGCSSLYWVISARKLIRLKKKFFEQNGGLILEEKLSKLNASNDAAKIFTIEELMKATNDFDDKKIVGQGGFGVVYDGVLPKYERVAIKKCLEVDPSQREQFINDVFELFQIDHKNVVKLLGCCLQAEVPYMVYEFISNGTLSQHIHEASIPWKIRLRIAKETAEVLSDLHSSASIIHRDVKSTNILLENDFTAKVSDFGASGIGPLDGTQLPTMVQGTFGYLDPEYFSYFHLSDKSDVYSFGVVLAELLTGRRAYSFDGPEKCTLLSIYFLKCMNENSSFLDDRIVKEGNTKQAHEVAILAQECLSSKGEERPTMKKVKSKLEQLMRDEEHLPTGDEENTMETDHLSGKSVDGASTSTTILSDQSIIPLEGNGER